MESGTPTFLFTDLEASTRRWEAHPEAMSPALARHDALLQGAVAGHGGTVFKHTGDGFCAVFPDARAALTAAVAGQQSIAAAEWGEVGPLRVRMALHSGTAEHRDGDWFGPALNRTARLLATAHGAQVVVSLATAELTRDVLPPKVELVDLGEHRLADLARTERVFQLSHPDLEAEFPPLRSLPRYRHNLPAPANPFVGREQELAEVGALLGSARLLTLAGIGGTGKTRLALAAGTAAAAGPSFPDGVFLVEFAALSDPSLVIAQSLAALGVLADSPDADGGGADHLCRYLAPRRLLLVLDNCEHLLDAVAALAQAVVERCPDVTVLTTSREPLGLPAEQVWRVPPLSPPDAVALLGERAQAADPGFRVDQGNAEALARIAHRLDGLPLALELAAARLRVLSSEQVAERLDDRFRLLTGGARTALPRHRTLRAAIDWSWDMLGPGERAVLRRLAVCAGTFNLEAAEAIAADDSTPGVTPGPGTLGATPGPGEVAADDVLDLISDLADKSLVAVEPVALQPGPGEARYRLSETVRHYAADRLAEAGEAVATRDRHRDFFVAVGRRESSRPYSRSASWFGRLAADRDNFRAALEWCFASGATLSALRLAGAIGELWIGEGRLDEANTWLERALAEASDAPLRTRGRVLCELAYVREERGELDAALAALGEASALFDAVSDPEGRLRVAMMKSIVVLKQGDIETAERLSHEGLSLAESLGTASGTAWCRFGLGWAALARGDREAAIANFEAAIAGFRTTGSWDLTPAALAALAPLVAAGGDVARANALIDEALTMARPSGRIHLVMALTRAAEVGVVLGDWQRVAAALSESLGLLSDIGGRAWVVESLQLAALVAIDRGRPGPAARLLGAGDQIRGPIGDRDPVRGVVGAEIDRARQEAAKALGSDAFAGETGRGGAMSPEAALAYALDQITAEG
jgi:predicted ATPase/class 3 adenylate cyclase